jgi:alkaline phosphatase
MNLLLKNGITHEFEGIVVYAQATDRFYVPSEALSIMNGTEVEEIKKK